MPQIGKAGGGEKDKFIMALFIPPAKKDFPLHPEGGPFAAVLSVIRSHEGVQTAHGVKDRLQLIFQTSELERDHVEGVDDDRPMTVCEFLNATFAEKGRLMGFLSQQVSGAALKPLTVNGATLEELEALLLGTQWMLSIVRNDSNGRTYANIANAMRAPDAQQISIWGEDGL